MMSPFDKILSPEKKMPAADKSDGLVPNSLFYMGSIDSDKIEAAIAAQLRTHETNKDFTPVSLSTVPKLHGCVRATPYGDCIESSGYARPNSTASKSWHKQRFTPALEFAPEGFDHVYGPSVIQAIDGFNDQQQLQNTNKFKQDIDEKEMLFAYRSVLYPHEEKKEGDQTTQHSTYQKPEVDGNEYGSIRTPLDAPIGSLKEKWRLLPYFLQLRSLMRQHIDSFDYFVNFDMKKVVQVR